MSLKEILLQDMKEAMKAKAEGKTALAVIRMIRSAIRNKEIDEKIELDDAGVGAVIAKEMKQRKESLVEFEKAGRDDLIAQIKDEIMVLEKYMPKQLSPEEVRQIVVRAIAGKSSITMGEVMKLVMPQVQGKTDGRIVSQVVKELLQQS
ncbi:MULTISPECIES: GatB/YqeY domain-containing protein [Megasphaera]|uniref:YqeY-like protein n=1 Tax=Megasphaera hutchinsoni TaxID=1588748 RepID=A0A134CII6_9FIRM|nr:MULTISPECIES: GatB/YqeY domain-containing protein [Megasphaera]EGS35708.1 YqeY-like protein [Megasphaera sp. UPII 135-E]KXB91934.1 YqeY-like protein [Megasphaera hutchinsoni]MUP48263.1 GatB/YqeY domain-containing protein [Veillonellaceae bacterium M2-8]MUP59426.1 GatB/YqeY domain-containing protein [Veillonellaceae bacterium M2-4]